MAYATLEQLLTDHLTQIQVDAEHHGALRRFLNVATTFIDNDLGISFTAAETGTEIVRVDIDTYALPLPANYVEDSVTAVTAPSGYSVPDDYIEHDGYLIVTTSDGVTTPPYLQRRYAWDVHFLSAGLWRAGVPYTIAGDFGHGAAPDDIKWLTCELAVLLWNGKAAGGVEVAATEAAVATIRANLSPLHRAVLEAHRVPSGFTFA